jgi:hypothetical protein
MGFSLDDRSDALGEPFANPIVVQPQTRVLLVANDFSGNDARDVAPPPGATLLRVGHSLATSGLNNAGEEIFLRDALGRRVSAAPSTPKPRSGVCAVRVIDDPRDGSEGSFDYDAEGTCTPAL